MHILVRLTGGLFEYELLEERPGFISVLIKGYGAKSLFENEPGGHRYQRCPPTEKRGRVHTSTITVAVLNPEADRKLKINESEIEIKTSRGSGPGGQHRNKVESCVTVVHNPTKISVRVDMRSQHQSKEMALKILAAKLYEHENNKQKNNRDNARRQQVGSGMRGDKIRTYRHQDEKVTDHRTGQTWNLRKWLKGEW